MTIEDVKVIIQGDETRTLEMKKTTGELKDGMRSACAFLNTAGGWLFFGIAPTFCVVIKGLKSVNNLPAPSIVPPFDVRSISCSCLYQMIE